MPAGAAHKHMKTAIYIEQGTMQLVLTPEPKLSCEEI